MTWPQQAQIIEVGPRDGLQNESVPVPTQRKLAFIQRLKAAGVQNIEVTSFVHPKLVPQLADAEEVLAGLPKTKDVTYSALVPNERGLDRALQGGVRRIAVFTAASETFTQRNIRMTIDESLVVFEKLIQRASAGGLTTRAYLSTCFVCPFEGEVSKERVADLIARLLEMGADEVAISDTIGAASPRDVHETVGHVLKSCPAGRIALHLHDTYGTALANVVAGLELGITTFDAAAGGLGGCPFAPGAAGNLATEDLVYLLDRMGIKSGVSLEGVVEAASMITADLGSPPRSRQWTRLAASTVPGRNTDI